MRLRNHPAKSGSLFQKQIDQANERYKLDGLALITRITPPHIPWGNAKDGRPVFIPTKKVEGDNKGFLARPIVVNGDAKYGVLVECKSRTVEFLDRRTFRLRELPRKEQCEQLDEALEFPIWVVLVVEMKLKEMRYPIVARFDWSRKDKKIDEIMLEVHEVKRHGLILDYLGLYGLEHPKD
jgi:hypothetical protein